MHVNQLTTCDRCKRDEMPCLNSYWKKILRGPRGTGFLYIQKKIANALQPSHVDHAAAPVVRVMSKQPNSGVHVGLEEENEFGVSHSYQPGAARFEQQGWDWQRQ
jgi:hypothetical protein